MLRHAAIWSVRGLLGLAMFSGAVSVATAQQTGKAEVELRWLEKAPIEGVTESEGFQSSCDPDSLVYPHLEPALVLTRAEVSSAKLQQHDFSGSGLSADYYMVTVNLTQAARRKLADACEGNEMRTLTVMVDGKPWGVHRYEKDPDKQFVPASARAETFELSVGFFSSRAEAGRLVRSLN